MLCVEGVYRVVSRPFRNRANDLPIGGCAACGGCVVAVSGFLTLRLFMSRAGGLEGLADGDAECRGIS